MTTEFLEPQRSIGNDLVTPMPLYRFPGLVPGDRWCVTARNWALAWRAGAAAPVALAATNEAVSEIVPLAALRARRRRPSHATLLTDADAALTPLRPGSFAGVVCPGSGSVKFSV